MCWSGTILTLDSAATRSFRRGGCAVKSAGKERYGEKKRRKQREKAVSQRRQGLERLWSAIPRYALYAAVMAAIAVRSEEHTSELQSLMRISYAVFCLQKKKTRNNT